MLRRLLVLFLMLAASTVGAQRVLTTPDLTSLTGYDGVDKPTIRKLLPLPDGGMIVFGRFDVWYEGQRFRDLLKIRPNGDPDTSWRVDITYSPPKPGSRGFLYDVSLTPAGLLLGAAYVDRVNGVTPGLVPYVSLATGQILNPAVVAPDRSGFAGYALSTYDRSTGYVYVASYGILQRLSATTGQVDSTWQALLGRGSDGDSFRPLMADARGGMWQGWCSTAFMFTTCGVDFRRINNAIPPFGDVMIWPLRFTLTGSSSVLIGRDHTFAGKLRFGADGAQDPLWATPQEPVFVSEKYAYMGFGGLERAPLSGNGTPDPWQFTFPRGYSLYSFRDIVPWPVVGDDEGVAVLAYKSGYLPVEANVYIENGPPVLIVKEDAVASADPTVVEYYQPALKRYFLTGRKNEQTALDALPQSFTRTGMKFAAKSSRYRDIAEQPVCRMYASPEKGMSNSHFYGVGEDCPTLNKLTGLKYEGFDFSVLKPTNSGCGADAPNAVSRLFNNKAATNDGNHRYVVSAATKAKMLAQGWIDEGAVFCSASVTDALN